MWDIFATYVIKNRLKKHPTFSFFCVWRQFFWLFYGTGTGTVPCGAVLVLVLVQIFRAAFFRTVNFLLTGSFCQLTETTYVRT